MVYMYLLETGRDSSPGVEMLVDECNVLED